MASKKDLLNNINPVSLFIGTSSTAQADEPTEKPTKARTSNKETKSQRVNLLLKESIWADLDKIATMNKQSKNDLINVILEQYLSQSEQQKTIQKYNEIF